MKIKTLICTLYLSNSAFGVFTTDDEKLIKQLQAQGKIPSFIGTKATTSFTMDDEQLIKKLQIEGKIPTFAVTKATQEIIISLAYRQMI